MNWRVASHLSTFPFHFTTPKLSTGRSDSGETTGMSEGSIMIKKKKIKLNSIALEPLKAQGKELQAK